MTIRKKLLLSNVIIVLVTTGLIALTLNSFHDLGQKTQKIQIVVNDYQMAQQVRDALTKNQVSFLDLFYLISSQRSSNEIQSRLEFYQKSSLKLKEVIQQFQTGLQDQIFRFPKQEVVATYSDYNRWEGQVMEQINQGKPASEFYLLVKGLTDRYLDLSSKIFNLEQSLETNIRRTFETINLSQQFSQFFLISLGVLILSILIFMSFLLRRDILSGLKTLKHAFTQIESGNLNIKFFRKKKDEFLEIGQQLEKIMVKLVSILGNITQLSQNTSEKSSAILTSTAKSKTTVDEVENYVRELTNSASELDNVFNVARSISAEVVSYVQRLQNQIFRQNNSIQEAYSAIHLISNSINDVSKQNKSMLSTVQKLHRSAKSGDENISAALSVINKTSSSAQIILDLLAVINDIAERTNMLAMNAAIEAAHAGVSGKGFAVVATEIRKLAESTAANSKSIEQSLQAVIQDIKNSRDAAISTAEVFESIYANVEMVSERMEEERKAVQQLTMDIFHVDKSLKQIVTTTKEVETISKEITSLNQKVDQTLSNITQVSTQTRSNTQKMSLLFYEMAKNFGNINKITRDFDDSVKKTVEELHKIVNL